MKKYYLSFLLLITLLSISSITYAQEKGKMWMIVEDAQDVVVYIDTVNIELTGNQLFVRNIIMYRNPVFMHTIQKMVKRVKSHLLMDTIRRTYSIIGAIFYDDAGRIIGESTDVLSTGGSSNFSLRIQPNSVYESILDKSLEFINTGKVTVQPSQYLAGKYDFSETEPVKKEAAASYTAPKETAVAAKPKTPAPAAAPVITKVKSDAGNKKPLYDSTHEKFVKNFVYTDGDKYVFQVAAFKRKKVAEGEVERLKRAGHDAFFVEVFISEKKGIWYRVRIGYFNSYAEAESYRKSM